MRIGFDIRPFLKQATGVGLYYKNLLFSLADIDRKNSYFLFSSSWKDRFPRQSLPPFASSQFRDRRYPVRLMDYLWQTWQWPPLDFFFGEELDLTHSPIPLILPSRGKAIVTVYDLFFLDYPLLAGQQAGQKFRRRIGTSLHKSDGVLTISRHVKDQIVERFGINESKVRAVYLGADASFGHRPAEKILNGLRKKFALPPSFLLFVGTIEPRKNLARLIEALSLVHRTSQRIPLVIAGHQGLNSNRVIARVRELDLGSDVRFLDYLPLQDLRALYHLATMLVLPSLSEGFGLPVVEAMTSGLPCALSHAQALPEIAQEAALYFDPENTEEMAQTIGRMLEDEDLRTDLIKRGRRRARDFSWRKTAEETLRFYTSLGEGGGSI
jgi:glycosyltransferase involved in cell wall biosynthesis